MVKPFVLRTIVAAAALSVLVACDSAEERAQKHLESGAELLEAGDVQRALVELRNVFALDADNAEARLLFARATRSIGNIRESYSNYLWIAERQPDNTEARLALTQMAIEAQDWDEAERHGAALIEANAEGKGAASAKLALDFRRAALDKNEPLVRELTAKAATLFQADQSDPILQRILIEGYARDDRLDEAFSILDVALAQAPNHRQLYMVRAQLLNRTGDADALEQHLRDTIARFPNDDQTKGILVRQLASQGRFEAAETFLREELAKAEDPRDPHVTLISFIRQTTGNQAALEELDKAIAAYENNRLFRALKAGILFDTGQREVAVSEMQAVLEGAQPGDETNRFKVSLAKMLEATGNEVGARQLVEDVLTSDPLQGPALKMTARWHINADQPEEALRALRTVLDGEPEDAEALTLMAEAHQRNGNHELAQDVLALAVEASGSAPQESLRLAQRLYQQESYRASEDVLIRSLRRTPGSIEMLELLGKIYLATEDWGRAGQVEATLRRQETDAAVALADELKVQILSRREGRDRAIDYLEQLAGSGDSNSAAIVALIRARLQEGRGEDALLLAEQLAEEFPDSARALLILGNTHYAQRNFDEAESYLRQAVALGEDGRAALQLVRFLGAQKRPAEARAALDEALTTHPDDANLLWAKASVLEQSLDVEGAIEIYETLYERDSNSLVVANNLASLLATYKDDDETLERAFAVARRLKGTEFPPFQDTYGWLLYRRGNFDEALNYLLPAAESIPGDPIVQYHLGKVYEAIGRQEEAAEAYRRVVEVASDADTRPQIAEAKAYLETVSGGAADQ